MPGERVLIVGAGVAGSVAAYWLAKHDFQVSVIERSRVDQKLGQGIEIEHPAFQVVESMNIMDQLEAIRTSERGFGLVDEKSHFHALFDFAGGLSPTGSLEMMRGDLCEVLYKAADQFPNVTYRFQRTIQSLRQTGTSVIAEIEDRQTQQLSSEEFDFVIGADGAKSRTRQLTFGSDDELDCLKPIGARTCYFSIPKTAADDRLSRVCHWPGRRIVWMRPVQATSDHVSVYLMDNNNVSPALQKAIATGDRNVQKEAWAERFSGLGWEVSRVLDGMMKSQNYYSDELKQVKLKTWSQDRVVLVGDAAWAPTPLTGQGNQLAIVGGFVLAQEMVRNRSEVAFQKFDDRLRAYVTEQQQIPFNGQLGKVCSPETAWGIWVLRKIVGTIAFGLSLIPQSWQGLGREDVRHNFFDLQMADMTVNEKQ